MKDKSGVWVVVGFIIATAAPYMGMWAQQRLNARRYSRNQERGQA